MNKPLKLKVDKRQVIGVSDWDDFVEQTYNRPYSFQQQDGCKERGTVTLTVPCKDVCDFENDTVPEVVNHGNMGVSFKAWLARNPKQGLPGREDTFGLGLWWARNFYPSVESIANDLHAKGLLPAGEYLINIDW